MTEKVLVVGAGIAGLGAAMAFGGSGREVTILDRDPPPPEGSVDDAFETWERKGATHLRHSHVFLARLFNLIRDRYPDLMSDLMAAGVRELKFGDGIQGPARAKYEFEPGDDDLSILSSRRTTLELIMRRYAARQPGITFITDAKTRGITTTLLDNGMLAVTGLKVERDDDVDMMAADIIVDASGRNTGFPDWLGEAGVEVPIEVHETGILYYTRHYRLLDGCEEPPRGKIPSNGDLGYIKYGVFPADNGCFSVTIALPEIEYDLRRIVMKGEVFDEICRMMPGVRPWIEEDRARPVSKVFGMGELRSTWRHYIDGDRPRVLNFFAIGDALARTNPLYGRGCSSGVLEAHLLVEVLDKTEDPIERAIRYDERLNDEVRPHFDSMVKQDLQAIRRAEHEQDPTYVPSLRARLIRSFMEDGLVPAMRGDLKVLRAFMKSFHMLENPSILLKRRNIVLRIVWFWLRGKRRNAAYYPPKPGPTRSQMFEALKIGTA